MEQETQKSRGTYTKSVSCIVWDATNRYSQTPVKISFTICPQFNGHGLCHGPCVTHKLCTNTLLTYLTRVNGPLQTRDDVKKLEEVGVDTTPLKKPSHYTNCDIVYDPDLWV